MKKFKNKIVSFILAFVFVVPLLFVFVGCNDNNKPAEPPTFAVTEIYGGVSNGVKFLSNSKRVDKNGSFEVKVRIGETYDWSSFSVSVDGEDVTDQGEISFENGDIFVFDDYSKAKIWKYTISNITKNTSVCANIGGCKVKTYSLTLNDFSQDTYFSFLKTRDENYFYDDISLVSTEPQKVENGKIDVPYGSTPIIYSETCDTLKVLGAENYDVEPLKFMDEYYKYSFSKQEVDFEDFYVYLFNEKIYRNTNANFEEKKVVSYNEVGNMMSLLSLENDFVSFEAYLDEDKISDTKLRTYKRLNDFSEISAFDCTLISANSFNQGSVVSNVAGADFRFVQSGGIYLGEEDYASDDDVVYGDTKAGLSIYASDVIYYKLTFKEGINPLDYDFYVTDFIGSEKIIPLTVSQNEDDYYLVIAKSDILELVQTDDDISFGIGFILFETSENSDVCVSVYDEIANNAIKVSFGLDGDEVEANSVYVDFENEKVNMFLTQGSFDEIYFEIPSNEVPSAKLYDKLSVYISGNDVAIKIFENIDKLTTLKVCLNVQDFDFSALTDIDLRLEFELSQPSECKVQSDLSEDASFVERKFYVSKDMQNWTKVEFEIPEEERENLVYINGLLEQMNEVLDNFLVSADSTFYFAFTEDSNIGNREFTNSEKVVASLDACRDLFNKQYEVTISSEKFVVYYINFNEYIFFGNSSVIYF